MIRICTNKKCTAINPQDISSFSKDKRAKDGFQSRCKACRSQFNKNNSEKAKLQSKIWKQNNPKRMKGLKLKRFWPTLSHDQSLIEYNKLLQAQNYVCAICKQPEIQKHQSGKVRDLAVDHDHKTGKVRGLLCGNCNQALGRLKDNTSCLESAIKYLMEHL